MQDTAVERPFSATFTSSNDRPSQIQPPMPLHRLVLMLLSCCLALNSVANSASDSASFTIRSISFEGIERNKPSYLLLQLRSRVGQQADTNTINQDLLALSVLPSVATADYRLDTLKQNINLVFVLEESVTAFPIVNIGLIEDNVWFRLGYGSLNIGGVGHQLSAAYQYSDEQHNVDLFYKVPRWGNSNWGNSLSISRYGSIEPLFFTEGRVVYNYEIQNIAGGVSYTIKNHQLSINASYFNEDYQKVEVPNFDETPGPDALVEQKLLFEPSYYVQKLRYHFFLLDGWDNRITGQLVENLRDGSQFQSISDQVRFFKRIGKRGNFAARFRIGIATNTESPFAPYVLDSFVNIRGVGNRVDRGTAQAIFNMEYRHQVARWRDFAAQLVVFSDQGNWRNPGGELADLVSEEDYRHFAGGGIRLIYVKGFNYVLRADYGFDPSQPEYSGFVIGVGQYF